MLPWYDVSWFSKSFVLVLEELRGTTNSFSLFCRKYGRKFVGTYLAEFYAKSREVQGLCRVDEHDIQGIFRGKLLGHVNDTFIVSFTSASHFSSPPFRAAAVSRYFRGGRKTMRKARFHFYTDLVTRTLNTLQTQTNYIFAIKFDPPVQKLAISN